MESNSCTKLEGTVNKQVETSSIDTTGAGITSASTTDARSYSELVDEGRYETFNDDQLSLKAALLYLVVALVGDSVIVLVSQFVFRCLSLPVFGDSQLIRSVATALIIITLTLITVLLYFFVTRGRDNHP